MGKTGLTICLAFLLSPFAAFAGVTPELQHAIRENTFVVTADSRFHAAVAQSPTLKDSVRLLGT